ncbi:hypothetical protein ACFS5N_00125 [Mucilaginibacter ximonensis]|uniref:Uncharacterized protein n=1 Tax=Mucilaginibacter ximonensis TaxID=538021 RepID=A0ABW5Y670_9SPHI
MAYNVITGEINYNTLYFVGGEKSVIYNSVTYTTGQLFRGISNIKSFTYSGVGTQALYEVTEISGGGVEYVDTSANLFTFPDLASIQGLAIEYLLADAEKTVQETTKIRGFAIELIDYPFYSFSIIETHL